MPTFTNQATLSYNNSIYSSNVAVGELVETISASKTSVLSSYTAQDNIAYVISISNSGAVAANNLTVSDNLGQYTFNAAQLYPLDYVTGSARYYINGVLQTAPTVTAGPPLVFSGISAPAGGNATIIYETTVNQYAPLNEGDSINNTATITGASIAEPLTVTETIPVGTDPTLSISKSVSPGTVTEGDPLTYTFIIQNTGNTAVDAADNAIINDLIAPILTSLSATFNGTLWTAGTNYTYNQATGAFATAAGQITVPAASYSQDPTTGSWIVSPGVSTLAITGIV